MSRIIPPPAPAVLMTGEIVAVTVERQHDLTELVATVRLDCSPREATIPVPADWVDLLRSDGAVPVTVTVDRRRP